MGQNQTKNKIKGSGTLSWKRTDAEKINLLLFLGSGISYASSLPNVDEITDSIFSKQWHHNSDQTFSPGLHSTQYYQKIDITPRLQEFLQIIKLYSDKYFLKRRQRITTYEDIFFICQQIYDNEKQGIDNPAIQAFINLIRKKTKYLCTSNGNSNELPDLGEIASHSLIMINCIIHQALYTKKEPQGLNLITDLANAYEYMDIATLNHDLLIESVLHKQNINFIDGFGNKDNDVSWFEPELYDDSKKIRLFKLHGSINWYRFRETKNIDGNVVTTDKYARILNGDSNHCKNSEGIYLDPLGYTPVFLTGTYNKLSSYNFGIIRMIRNKFENRLWEHNIMIMSGYGWNDRGINGLLFEWLLSSFDRRLILLHKQPEEKIKKNSKSAMNYRYDELVKAGRLIPIKKWFSEISIEDIQKFIKKIEDKGADNFQKTAS